MKTPLAGRFSLFAAQLLAALGGLGLLASWLAPNHYPPWTSFHSEAAAFAALCCFAAARALQPRPARAGAWLRVPALLLGIIALQYGAGQIHYSGDALLSGVYIAGAALAFWVGLNTEGEGKPDALTCLAALLVAGAAVSVLLGVLQWHRLEQSLGIFAAERGPEMRVYANLGQPNHLATLCVMGTVLAWWLWMRKRIVTWQFAALACWLTLGVVLTESRSGLLSALLIGLLLLWRRRLVPHAVALVLAWWALLAAGNRLLPGLNKRLFLDLVRPHGLGDDNQRYVMWRQAVAAIEDAPWLGHGWRQSLLALKKASAQVHGTLVTDYAHNVVLDVLAWVGIPLGVLLVGAALFWLARMALRVGDARQLVLFAAFVPFLVHSQFEFPFAYAYLLFPALWLLGALHAAQHPPAATGTARRDARAPAMLLVVAFGWLCSAVALEYLEAEEDYRVMRFELRNVGRVPEGHEAPRLHLLTQVDDLLVLGRVPPRPGMPPELVERIGAASARNGWPTLDLNYAVALGLNGRPDAAADALAVIGSAYGKDPQEQALAIFREYRAAHPELGKVRTP